MSRAFFGLYRGEVVNNVDPMTLGRVQVAVPEVLGSGQLAWAMPCVQYAGYGVGGFAVPPVRAKVWVQFEGGNPDFPVLAGCFWGDGEVPGSGVAEIASFTSNSVTITANAVPGTEGLVVEVGSAKLEITPTSIEISLGSSKVTLDNASVSINGDALKVM